MKKNKFHEYCEELEDDRNWFYQPDRIVYPEVEDELLKPSDTKDT